MVKKGGYEKYKEIFGDFWFETPVYYFNLEYSLRFELIDRVPDEEYKVLKFLNELFNDLFLDDVYLILPFAKGITSEKLSLYGVEVNKDVVLEFDYYTRLKELFKDIERYQDIDVRYKCKVFKLRKRDFFIFNLFCRLFVGGLQNIVIPIVMADIDKKVFFHIYDNRGCDVVIKDKEFMKEIYEKYSDWILECNRDEIIKKIYG